MLILSADVAVLSPHTAESPHTALNAPAVLSPQTAESPQTALLPRTNTESPHTAEVLQEPLPPHNADVPNLRRTFFVAGS